MTAFSQLLRNSEKVLQRRLQWLRRRKILAPRPRPIRVRDLVADLFAAPDIAPAPT